MRNIIICNIHHCKKWLAH